MSASEHMFPWVFPVVLVGLWCLLLKSLSMISGWSRLAQRFYWPGAFHGKRYRFQSARLNGVGINNGLSMGVSEQGLYLLPVIIIRPFHRPLLIPWGEIQVEPAEGFLFKGYRLSFRSVPDVRMDIPSRTFEKMVDYLKAR